MVLKGSGNVSEISQSTHKSSSITSDNLSPSFVPVVLKQPSTETAYFANPWLIYFNNCLIAGRGTQSQAFNAFYSKFKENPKSVFMNSEMQQRMKQVSPDFQPLTSHLVSKIVPLSEGDSKEGNCITFTEFRDWICANVLVKRTNKDIKQSFMIENGGPESRRQSLSPTTRGVSNSATEEMRDPPLNVDSRSSIAESLFRLFALTPHADQAGNVAAIQQKIIHTGFLDNNECFLSILLLLFLTEELSELYYVQIHSLLSKDSMHYEHTTSRSEFRKIIERFWVMIRQLAAGVNVEIDDEGLEALVWESLHETFSIAGEKRGQIRVTRSLELLIGILVSFCGVMVFVKQSKTHLENNSQDSSSRKKAKQIVKNMLNRGLTVEQLSQFLQSIQLHPSNKKIQESLEDEFQTQNTKQVLTYGSILKYFAKLFVAENTRTSLTKALTVEKLELGNVIMFVRKDFMQEQMGKYVRPMVDAFQQNAMSNTEDSYLWWNRSGQYEAFLTGNKKSESRYSLSQEIQDMFVNTEHFPTQGTGEALPPPVLFGVVHQILRAEHRIFAEICGATFMPPQDNKEWIRQYFFSTLRREVDDLERRLFQQRDVPELLKNMHPTYGKHTFVIKLPVYFFNQLFHFTTINQKGKLQCKIRSADELCAVLTFYEKTRKSILKHIPLIDMVRRRKWPETIPNDFYLKLHISENNPLVVTILDELNAEISCHFRIMTKAETNDKLGSPDASFYESLAAEDLQFNVVYLGDMEELHEDTSKEIQLKERVKKFLCPDGASLKNSVCVEAESEWEFNLTNKVRVNILSKEDDNKLNDTHAEPEEKRKKYELRPYIAVRALTLTNYSAALRATTPEFKVLPNRLITAKEFNRFSELINGMLRKRSAAANNLASHVQVAQ